ncbi:hypothetical protein ACBQ57_22665 [Escherichia coli]
MLAETYQRGTDVRQNAVTDVLLIIIFSLSLLICGKVSADTGWQSGGEVQGAVEFGGGITPYDDSLPPWLWKTGGYTGFSNKISELTGNGTRLTLSAPHNLLLLAGKSARAFEGSETSGAGIVPVIQLKGNDGSQIHIQWAS